MTSKIKVYEIDASGKSLGRLATEVAQTLRGKREVDFTPYKLPGILVKVSNISKIKSLSFQKKTRPYYYHTGWPGGLKEIDRRKMAPARLLRLAVLRMLKKNRLRAKLMKNLSIKNSS